MATFFALALALGLIVLRVPIGASFVLSSSLSLLLYHSGSVLVPLLAFRTVDNFVLIAIPLFLIAAELMLRGGVAEVIVSLLVKLSSKVERLMPAGVVAAAMFFGGITGASVAETAALGRITYPVMQKYGYYPRDIAGLVAVSANLGILIPPSLTLIFYGVLTQTSIPRLFLAGVVPGVITAVVLAIVSLVFVRRSGADSNSLEDAPWVKVLSKVRTARHTGRRAHAAAPLVDQSAIWPDKAPFGGESSRTRSEGTQESVTSEDLPWSKLVLPGLAACGAPVIVFGGIYGGFATPTEVAALLTVYAAIVTLVWQGPLAFVPALFRSASDTSMIFMILVGAGMFTFIATSDRIPQRIAENVLSLGLNRWQFLVALVVILIVLGMFIDGLSMMLLTLPLVFPAAMALGIDPIHFGIIYALNIETAAITPPVGVNLFAISAVTGMEYGETVRAVMRYYPISLALDILFIAVPWFSIGVFGGS